MKSIHLVRSEDRSEELVADPLKTSIFTTKSMKIESVDGFPLQSRKSMDFAIAKPIPKIRRKMAEIGGFSNEISSKKSIFRMKMDKIQGFSMKILLKSMIS